jgi:hypothetical protein
MTDESQNGGEKTRRARGPNTKRTRTLLAHEGSRHNMRHGDVPKRARVRGGVGRQATATWQLTAHGHSQREPAEAELVDRGAVACGAVERGAVERGDDERGAGERGACLWARRGAVRSSVIPSGIAPCRARRRAAGESRVRAGRAQRKERNRAHIVHAERSCARTFASLPNRSAAWP